jgi:DNA-binding GntR family transcriptional regulator
MSTAPLGEPPPASSGEGPVERRGLRDAVYDRILDQLLRGEPEAGRRLSIETLARQLSVSATPVREALVELERTGLVTREALRGYRVAPPLGADQMAELFEARLMLETTAVFLAMGRTNRRPELVDRLQHAHARHLEAGARLTEMFLRGDLDVAATHEYFACDHDFHAVFFGLAGNRYVQDMSDSLGAQVHRMRQIILRGENDVRDAVQEHEAILTAVLSDDADAAHRAMRTHIEQVRDRSIATAD